MIIPRLALSVRQPWAYGLAMGWKDVENRSWRAPNPALHHRGPFAIHASLGMTRDEYEDAADTFEHCGFECPPPADLLRGGIIGIGEVVDIVKESESPWFCGPRGLVVAGAQPVPFIRCNGQLGFFEWKRAEETNDPALPAKWMLPAQPKTTTDTQGRLF